MKSRGSMSQKDVITSTTGNGSPFNISSTDNNCPCNRICDANDREILIKDFTYM